MHYQDLITLAKAYSRATARSEATISNRCVGQASRPLNIAKGLNGTTALTFTLLKMDNWLLTIVDKDYAEVMKGFNESTRQLKNAFVSLFGASGALLPVFTELIQDSTIFVNSIAEWTAANPELTATIVKATAGLLAFGIATRVLGFGFAQMQGGLWKTAAMFLKFNKAGRNVSTLGNAFRRLNIASRRSTRSLGLAQRLLRAGFKFGGWGIKPLKWTARLIPAVPWRKLGKMLSWGKLVRPLAWTSKLIPAIGWSKIAPRLGKFGWGMVITPLKWAAKAGTRFIPIIGWALLAADLGILAWDLVVKPLGWDEFISREAFINTMNSLTGWDWGQILNVLDWTAFLLPNSFFKAWQLLEGKTSWDDIIDEVPWDNWLNFVWKDVLPKWSWDFIPEFDLGNVIQWPEPPDWLKWLMGDRGEPALLNPGIAALPKDKQVAAQTVQSAANSGPLPTDQRINRLAAHADYLRGEMASLQADLDGIAKDGLKGDMAAAPIKLKLAERQQELYLVEQKLTDTKQKSVELSNALKSLSGIDVSPEINSNSIDLALNIIKTARIDTENKVRGAMKPLPQMMREAHASTPTPPMRPEPQSYRADQPNVTVESTFESKPEVNVSVKVPVHITRQQTVNNAAIARKVGQEAERATRRGLDDAAIAED